jgi:hypothetical protein
MGPGTADGSDMVTVVGSKVALAKSEAFGPCPPPTIKRGTPHRWLEGISVVRIDCGRENVRAGYYVEYKLGRQQWRRNRTVRG